MNNYNTIRSYVCSNQTVPTSPQNSVLTKFDKHNTCIWWILKHYICATMNKTPFIILFAISTLFHAGIALAQIPDGLVESGEPNGIVGIFGTGRGAWSSKSHKSSKSTQSPTDFPTMSPTYCGKASKSTWHSGSRRLGSWSKSAKCSSGPRSSSSDRRGANRMFPVGKIKHTSVPEDRNERELGQEEDVELKPNGVQKRRRRLNDGKRSQLDETEA